MTRDEALAALKAKPEPFEREGFACTVHPLLAGDMLAAQAWAKEHGKDSAYQFLFVRSVRNGDGSRLFSDEDAPLVETFPGGVVNDVLNLIYRLSGIGGDEKKAHSMTPDSPDSGKSPTPAG